MGIRIMLANMSEDPGPVFGGMLHRLFKKVCRPDTELTIRSLKPGLMYLNDAAYRYERALHQCRYLEVVMQAQQEGFDAVVSTCSLDAGMWEARELVDIPVLTTGETAVHYASLLGGTFGVVTLLEQGVINSWREIVASSGLKSKAIVNNPVRGISVNAWDAEKALMEDPSIVVRACEETAKELARDGAEVIIIGCGLYGPMCADAGFVKLEGDVPVVDPMTVCFKIAEDMVIFKNSLGMPALSRIGKYQRIPDEDIQRIRDHFGFAK